MKGNITSRILLYAGFLFFVFGVGWYFGMKFGEVEIEIWRAVLMVIGLFLMVLSAYQWRKRKRV